MASFVHFTRRIIELNLILTPFGQMYLIHVLAGKKKHNYYSDYTVILLPTKGLGFTTRVTLLQQYKWYWRKDTQEGCRV